MCSELRARHAVRFLAGSPRRRTPIRRKGILRSLRRTKTSDAVGFSRHIPSWLIVRCSCMSPSGSACVLSAPKAEDVLRERAFFVLRVVGLEERRDVCILVNLCLIPLGPLSSCHGRLCGRAGSAQVNSRVGHLPGMSSAARVDGSRLPGEEGERSVTFMTDLNSVLFVFMNDYRSKRGRRPSELSGLLRTGKGFRLAGTQMLNIGLKLCFWIFNDLLLPNEFCRVLILISFQLV